MSEKSSEDRLSHNHGHNKVENARSKSKYQWAGLNSCTCSEAAPLLMKDPRSAPATSSSSSSTFSSDSSRECSRSSHRRHKRHRRHHRSSTRHRHDFWYDLSLQSSVACAPPLPRHIQDRIHRGKYACVF